MSGQCITAKKNGGGGVLTFVNDPEAAAGCRLFGVEVEIQDLVGAYVVVSLLQKGALFAPIALGLQVEAGFTASWIAREQLKRNDGQDNSLIVISAQLAPAVLGGAAESRAREIGRPQRAPLIQVDNVATNAVNTILCKETTTVRWTGPLN